MSAPAQPAPLQSIHVGDIEVTFLPDGEGHFVPTQMFPASTPEAWEKHERWLSEVGRVVTTLGAFLIRSGDRNVIVDLGIGPTEMEIPDFVWVRSGALLESLSRAGLAAADVDTVLFTHLHSDHTGWTTGEAGLTFPNARHLVGDKEVEYWRDHQDDAFAPPADSVLDPIADRVEIVADQQTIAPGVTIRATPGHTPGHQSVIVSFGTDRAVILGDIMHCPAQLTEPDWGVLFDVDPDAAKRTRDAVLEDLEGTDVPLGCSHFPEAAFGRVVVGEGKRYWQAHGS